MSRFQPQILIGVFAVLTAIFAGAVLGRLLGLPANEGAYLMVLLLAVVGFLAERRAHHREERP